MNMKAIAIITAAGSSQRMGTAGDKIFADLCGKPVLQYSIEAFQAAKSVDEIIVVCSDVEKVRKLCDCVTIVKGGNSRAESVLNGINAIDYTDGIVLIHDGARPLITPRLIDEVAANCPAIPAIPVKDTVKICRNGFIESTPARDLLEIAQTPQVFGLREYRKAVEDVQPGVVFTDDAMLMEQMGIKVKIVQGDERNIKITTPEDLKIAEVLLDGFN